MSKSPAAILYDATGQNPVAVVLDGVIYRLQTEAQVQTHSKGTTAAGSPTSESVDANVHALHVKMVGGGGGPGVPGTHVRIVDANGLPLDSAEEGPPSSPNGLMIEGWEEVANRVHKVAVDAQGHLVTVSAGKLGNMINLFYRATIGAIVADQFRKVLEYTVPTGYSAYLIRYSSWQAEAAYSRVAARSCFGTLNVPTNVYSSIGGYIDPQFAGVVEAEVTTAFGAVNNITVTVGYTNQSGVAGRTGSISVPKSSIVGTRLPLILQTGDIGVRSIQSASASPSGGAGVLSICGFIQFALHFDLDTTRGVDTNYAPGAISFPAGTVVTLEFSGGTVAKDRVLNSLIQLVAV